jgi:competence protein ComEA
MTRRLPFSTLSRRARLLPSLLLALLSVAVAAPASRGQAGKPAPAASAAATPAQPMDINTASEADLKTLPGIGDAYAKRIVQGRPYTAKNQLISKGLIPASTYDKIKDSIVAKKAKP